MADIPTRKMAPTGAWHPNVFFHFQSAEAFGEPARWLPGWMHPVARIGKSRVLTAHLIHAKTDHVLHLLLESGVSLYGTMGCGIWSGKVKVMQLLRNLYQVGGDLNGITWCGVDMSYADANTYAIQTADGIVLIDCGNGETLPQIFDNMRYWGLNPDDIRACLLTHAHLDHAGAAWLLKQRKVQLCAHRETTSAVASGDERCCGFLYHKPFPPVKWTALSRTVTTSRSVE